MKFSWLAFSNVFPLVYIFVVIRPPVDTTFSDMFSSLVDLCS